MLFPFTEILFFNEDEAGALRLPVYAKHWASSMRTKRGRFVSQSLTSCRVLESMRYERSKHDGAVMLRLRPLG